MALPADVRGRTNPKSSTGRIDVFTRVISDESFRFDEIPAGYDGPLFLEIVPRSFAVRVRGGPDAQPAAARRPATRAAPTRRSSRCTTSPRSSTRTTPRSRCGPASRRRPLPRASTSSAARSRRVQARPQRAAARPRARRRARRRVVLGADLRRRRPHRPAAGGVLSPDLARAGAIPPWLAAEMTAYDPTSRRAAHALRGLLRSRLRLRPAGTPPGRACGARSTRARRSLHGRARAAHLQARLRADARSRPTSSTGKESARPTSTRS